MKISKLREITIQGPNAAVIGASLSRCKIWFFPPFAGTTTWSTGADITGAGNGIQIPAASPPLALDRYCDGSIVTESWYASGSAYPHSFAILEVFDGGEE